MKFWFLLPLACWWITSAAFADDCSLYLSRQPVNGTSIRFTPAFSSWMHNADEEEDIEFLIYMSNGTVRFSRRPEAPAIHVSGVELSLDEYHHRTRLILHHVHGADLNFIHSQYLSSIRVGVIHISGHRDAIAKLVDLLEHDRENLNSLQFMFR